MRRLLRWVFDFAAAVSALLFVGLCVLWARGYRVQDRGRWCSAHDWSVGVLTRRGEIEVEEATLDEREVERRLSLGVTGVTTDVPGFTYEHGHVADDGDRWFCTTESHWSALGFAFRSGDFDYRLYHVRRWTAPLWALASLVAVMPGLYLRGRLAVPRRAADGLCPQCGYDLRATPGRCPECGAVPKRA